MIFRPCCFYFFSALCEWGGWVLKSAENSALFLKPSKKTSHIPQHPTASKDIPLCPKASADIPLNPTESKDTTQH